MNSHSKLMIEQSAYDECNLQWEDKVTHCDWPLHYILKGGQTSKGDSFVFASSTTSHKLEDVAEARIFYGVDDTIELAEEDAFKKYHKEMTLEPLIAADENDRLYYNSTMY